MSLSWENAIAGTEAKANMRGPHNPYPQASPANGYDKDPNPGVPEAARAKLVALGDKLGDIRTLSLEAFDRRNELIAEKTKATHRLATLTDPAVSMRDGNGFTYPPDNPSVVDAQGKLDKITTEHKRISEKCDDLASRSQLFGSLHSACERYLKQMQGQTLAAFDGMKPKTRRNESHLKATERFRAARATLEADLHAIQAAPITAAEAKDAIRQEIADLAQRGMPDCFSLLERGAAGIGWPTRIDKIAVDNLTPSISKDGDQFYGQAVANNETLDMKALFCWLHKDALIDALEAEVDSVGDDSKSLTGEERQAREGSTLAAILDGERAEEFYCELIEADGGTIERRCDLDPRAYLNVEGPRLLDW